MKTFLYILFFLPIFSFAQQEKEHLQNGNTHYEKGEYEQAVKEYKQALEVKPGYEQAEFNLGDALYQQEKYADAAAQYNKVISSTADEETKASSYHNLGNSLIKTEKYEDAVEAYKNALRINPSDQGTRQNLSLAQKKLLQQQEQDKKDDQNKEDDKKDEENKDDQKKDENKDKDGNEDNKDDDQKNDKEGEDKDDEKKSDENKDGKGDKDDKDSDEKNNDEERKEGEDNKNEGQQSQPQSISKEDAQRMLEALNEAEDKTQQKVQHKKIKVGTSTIEKDW